MSNIDEQTPIIKILRTCENPCVVDLGAYLGEDSHWMVNACKNPPRLVMVEPDPGNFSQVALLASSLAGRGVRTMAIEGAISDHTGTCDFWACYTPPGRGSGSIRRPTGHLKKNPDYDFRKLPAGIPCYSLDHLFILGELDHIDILWVDIQGAERDMIAGGKEALKHTRYMFIEAEEVQLYDGQAIRPELLAMLPGWIVTHTFDFNLLLRNERHQ